MNKYVSRKLKLGLLVGYSLLLLACSSSDAAPPPLQKHPLDTLRIDIGSEVRTLDPALVNDAASVRIVNDLFAGLLDFDQKNNPIAGMAAKWEISPDGLKYTFHLRPNLKFSDGSAITASDFVYSFRRVVNPKTNSRHNYLLAGVTNGQAIINQKLTSDRLGVTAKDPQTLIIQLDHSDPNFLNYLALTTLSVVPRETIQQFANNWTLPQNIVTSGAYTLSEQTVNGSIQARKNPYYYDKAQVSIAKVIYSTYTDPNAGIIGYRNGNIDLIYQNVPLDQYQGLNQEFPLELHTIKQEAFYFYDLNQMLALFADNPKLRQALAMTVDRETLVTKVLGHGELALYSNITPTIESGVYSEMRYEWSYEPYLQKVSEANQLYAAAGYSQSSPLVVTLSYDENDLNKKVALAVAQMWKEALGVQVTVVGKKWKTFVSSRRSADYSIDHDRWIADYNSVNTYSQLYLCNSPQNNSHYCNLNYDKLVHAAEKIPDSKRKQQLYKQALELALNDYQIIPLFQPNYSKLIKPYIYNLDVDDNHFNIEQSKWIKFKG